MENIKLGKYQHYKGKLYEVIGTAKHSETLEDFVVYKALYNSEEFGKNALFIRPKKMFLESMAMILNDKVKLFTQYPVKPLAVTSKEVSSRSQSYREAIEMLTDDLKIKIKGVINSNHLNVNLIFQKHIFHWLLSSSNKFHQANQKGQRNIELPAEYFPAF